MDAVDDYNVHLHGLRPSPHADLEKLPLKLAEVRPIYQTVDVHLRVGRLAALARQQQAVPMCQHGCSTGSTGWIYYHHHG